MLTHKPFSNVTSLLPRLRARAPQGGAEPAPSSPLDGVLLCVPFGGARRRSTRKEIEAVRKSEERQWAKR